MATTRRRLHLRASSLAALLLALLPAASLAADYGKAPDVKAVRSAEETALRSEIPPVQRDVLAVTVSNVVVGGAYAVCSYSVGESAGYSVYARNPSGAWKRIGHGGEAPTKASLRALGVPPRSISVFAAHGGI